VCLKLIFKECTFEIVVQYWHNHILYKNIMEIRVKFPVLYNLLSAFLNKQLKW